MTGSTVPDPEPVEAAVSIHSALSVKTAISNEMVRIYKEKFGRGPTKARTEWAGPDAIVVLLEETLTPIEQDLLRAGQERQLRDTRIFLQYATVADFCNPVERITGRRVRSFISGIDTQVEGLSTETFILYPEGTDGPSRGALPPPA
jgi:uncharacterized protein YbcI